MTRISLCMIVRDEEAILGRCLDSVVGIVDEICVVDTGSTDGTVEVARDRGARVEHFEWCDDFAAARNASIAMAEGEWILVLDADEFLEDDDARRKLDAFVAAHPDAAGQVTIVDRQEEGELRSRVTRFLPCAHAPSYQGCFHEQPHLGEHLAPTMPLDLEIVHTGYRADEIAAKGKVARNLRFLEQLVEEDPTDAYLHYQLGRTYWVGEDPEAALESFTRALDHTEPDAPYLALLLELTGHAMRKLGRSLEALSLYQQVAGAFQDRADSCYLEALLALDVGHLELAEARFQRCLTLPGVDGHGGSSAESARTWGPAYHLGVMRECLGMAEEAREYYELALSFRPEHPESKLALERLTVD